MYFREKSHFSVMVNRFRHFSEKAFWTREYQSLVTKRRRDLYGASIRCYSAVSPNIACESE